MIGLPPGTWTPMHVLWGILAFIGLLIVEGALVAPFDPHLHTLTAALALQAALAVTLVGVAFGFAAMPRSGFAEPWRLGLRRFRRSAIGWAALALLGYIVFAAIYAPLVQPHQEDVARDLGLGESAIGAIAAGILIIGVAPISEEIFFRGFVFAGLRRRMPLWAAAVISGTVFGIFHFTGIDSIGVVPQLAVLGTILAVLYEKTGSLWPAIMVHMVNNILAFAYLASK
jgi:membrane protease YdiL (CAAX protease family)